LKSPVSILFLEMGTLISGFEEEHVHPTIAALSHVKEALWRFGSGSLAPVAIRAPGGHDVKG
jgi:hypothetical protein